jgi:SNF2-related domain/SNF2 Helicase protein/Helicase conserved C-terminal domain
LGPVDGCPGWVPGDHVSSPSTVDDPDLESVIWRIADGRGSEDDLDRLRADAETSLGLVDALIRATNDDLGSVRSLTGSERDQVIADLTETVQSLRDVAARLRPPPSPPRRASPAPQGPRAVVPGEIELQASWTDGKVVVWAGGPGRTAESHDEVSARLEAVGAAPVGWQAHPGVRVAGGSTADSHAIGLADALGWLVSIGAGHRADEVGDSLRWLGRVAYEGVRLTAAGSIVPTLRVRPGSRGQQVAAEVRWRPALVDRPIIAALAAAMPGPVAIIGRENGRSTTIAVLTAVVEAIVAEGVERMELPAAPPSVLSARDVQDAVIAGMDGSPFQGQRRFIDDVAQALDRWTRGVTSSSRPTLIVQLDAPGEAGVWLVSILVDTTGGGRPVPIDEALRQQRGALTAEWERLGRAFPSIERSTGPRRSQLALTQDQAWELMTSTGPMLAAIGFDVRVPTMSRRKATPMLRLLAESSDTVVGAHQLSNVAWSMLFDDVELTAADIARLARQARPLVRSRNGWVEVDRVDLEQAAAALAERADDRQLTGAEILRHSLGLDGAGMRVDVRGHSWATEILARAAEASASPVTRPQGFTGELRAYQAEALAWIGFLERADLGGCLALDMGLGKTPTVLAHLARVARSGPALVIAPAAVVGNWAAEAARFVPGLRVVIHHGASRATAAELAAEIDAADVLITTYATAVRDIDALAASSWATCVLDEAQAIKNPASETAQQLRRIPSRLRLALTGTPIENGLGDLWAILDFTNPGLVGTRPAFVSQLAGDAESALRSLNGLLVFRRTKREPEVAAELPDKIDELDHCTMTPEQIGLYQAVLDELVADVAAADAGGERKKGAILAAITALKQICNHPAAYRDDGQPLAGRSGKLARLEEIVAAVFAAGERVLVFTHFATWGRRLADHLTEITGTPVASYDGSLARGARDRIVTEFQHGTGPGALVLSLKAGGTGLNLTAANHVVLYDRWWNPAVEDQARDRAWRIGQQRSVISHRLVCPGTIDERVEEVVAGKRHIAQLVLPRSSSIADLDVDQLRHALGLQPDELLADDSS